MSVSRVPWLLWSVLMGAEKISRRAADATQDLCPGCKTSFCAPGRHHNDASCNNESLEFWLNTTLNLWCDVCWWYLPLLARLSGRRFSLRPHLAWWLSRSLFMARPSFSVAVGLQPNNQFSCLWTALTTSGWRHSRWVPWRSVCVCLLKSWELSRNTFFVSHCHRMSEHSFALTPVSFVKETSDTTVAHCVVLCCRGCWRNHQTVQCGWLPLRLTAALWEWSTV